MFAFLQLLSSSRPPKHLPGILASIFEVSFDSPGPLCAKNHQEAGDDFEGSSLLTNLVSLSLNALASLASLYGGEYCRDALSAAGLRGFTTALQRNDSRNNTRLLLRILRRLCESDEVCLRRLTGPAARPLYSVISRLRCVENGNGGRGDAESHDPVTVRLAQTIIEQFKQCPGTLVQLWYVFLFSKGYALLCFHELSFDSRKFGLQYYLYCPYYLSVFT